MQISCPQCSAQYNVEEARIPPQGVSITCPRCSNQFIAKKGDGGAGIALPGRGGAVPLPGATAGAVPLPGAAAMAVPLPGASGGGVPLPGSGGGIPLPGGGGGIPLPGSGGGVPLPGNGGGGSIPSMEDIFGGAPAPAPQAAGGGPPGKSLSMNDIFGDVSAPGSAEGGGAPHPFHGTNSVLVDAGGGGGGVLDFIDGAGKADAMPKTEQYSIRKRSGRVLGPFDVGAVLGMFEKGELLGSEEASSDGVTWRPLAQIPSFSSTIQRAMASALAGLDNLPMPKGSDMENLPAPKGSGGKGGAAHHADLPAPMDDLPAPRRNQALAAAQEAFPELGTEALREAEKAKETIEKKRRAKKEGGRAFPALAGLAVVGVVLAVGVGLQFATPYGYFGYKLVFKDTPVEPEKLPDPIVEAPPPPLNPNTPDRDFGDLLRADTYASYRQGADQAGRTVEAGKAMTPFPESAKKAAAQQARFLGYLVVAENLPSFLPQLKATLPLAGGDEAAKALGEAAVAYSDKQWDKGLAALAPFKDPARGLDPFTRSEVLVWSGLMLRGKADDAGAVKEWDEALTSSTRNALALFLQAEELAFAGQREAAIEYCDKVLALSPQHARAGILKGHQLALNPSTLEQGRTLLAELSDGKAGEAGSPQQRAEAFLARADLAIASRNPTDAVRFLQKAVETVPQNRSVRVQVAETTLQLHDFNVAREHGKKLLEQDPNDVDGIIIVARAKMASRDTLAAYTDLQAVAKRAPNNAVAAYWFGVAAREMSKADEARSQFEKATKLDPRRADAIVDLMTELIEQGKLDDALKRGDTAETQLAANERYKVRSAKAYALMRKRSFVAAEKELKTAMQENPKDYDVQARYATLLVGLKRFEDAEKVVDDALAVDGKNPTVLVAAGDVAFARGNAKAALDRFQEAMQIAPNAHQPYLHAALAAIELKDQQRAKGFVDTAGQLRSSVTDVVAVQGLVQKASDPKQGARLLQQAIEQSPLEPALSYQLGMLFSQMGAPLESVDALKRAVQLDPLYVDAHFLLGKVNRELSRPVDAKASFDECVHLDDKRVDCWVELADILAQSNKDGEALKAYEHAIAADPKNFVTTCALGETLVQRMGDEPKNLKRGLTTLERCVSLNPQHPSAWKNLGNGYKTQGKKRDALRAYRQHLQVSPNDEENELVRDFIKEVGG